MQAQFLKMQVHANSPYQFLDAENTLKTKLIWNGKEHRQDCQERMQSHQVSKS